MMRFATLYLLSLALLAGGTGASAQGLPNPLRPPSDTTPCVLDKCLDGSQTSGRTIGAGPATPEPAPTRRDPARFGGSLAPGDFDFYVLSLSWSPDFCDSAGSRRTGRQCAPGARLGFVVHGLWPQNMHGYPSDCDNSSRFVPRAALDPVRGLYPDEGLARHEWRKHGTCTGLSPSAYFNQVRQARDAITIPPSFQAPDAPQTLAPIAIERAFMQANPGLRPDMMAVTCRQGELQEVHLCFGKDLRAFVSCPDVHRAACHTQNVTILPVR